ncbi:MAG: hypothetical protein AAGD07_00070 [Planctomycetota bacterium]
MISDELLEGVGVLRVIGEEALQLERFAGFHSLQVLRDHGIEGRFVRLHRDESFVGTEGWGGILPGPVVSQARIPDGNAIDASYRRLATWGALDLA